MASPGCGRSARKSSGYGRSRIDIALQHAAGECAAANGCFLEARY
jgi:hypothetical protein